MSPDGGDIRPTRDDHDPDPDYGAEEEAPSIFSTTWFRATVVAVVLAVVGIIALPYILDWLRPPVPAPTAMAPAESPAPPAPASPPPSATTPEPAAPPPAGTSPSPASPGPETSSSAMPVPAPGAGPPPAATPPHEPMATEPAQPLKPAGPPPPKREPPAATPRARASKDKDAEPLKVPRRTAQAETPKRSAVPMAGARTYWVQVGAFRDSEHARALVAKLRASNITAEEVGPGGGARSAPAPRKADTSLPGSPVDKYDVFVVGAPASEIQSKLAAKGLAADPVAGGAVLTPSLPLRDAVTLSKDLAAEGLKVQVRRASAASAERELGSGGSEGESTGGGSGDGLYRVRVGGFPDRAAAEAARQELGRKGFAGFVTRNGQ